MRIATSMGGFKGVYRVQTPNNRKKFIWGLEPENPLKSAHGCCYKNLKMHKDTLK